MTIERTAAAQARLQDDVERFWDALPCGSALSSLPVFTREYFEQIEFERYKNEPHILDALNSVPWRGREVLEIGAGIGTDGRKIIERGGRYTGINVDAGSTRMASEALLCFDLPGRVFQCSATDIRLPDHSVDVVYSFGVLHHIPDVARAMAEIRRVLRPGGELVVMLYNRDSINYRLEIRLLRRWMRGLLRLPGAVPLLAALGLPRTKLERHADLARCRPEMSDQEWLSRNTDGPDNPHTMVYDASEVRSLLNGFEVLRQDVRFFDARHWGALGSWLPAAWVTWLGHRWGWHRFVHARLTATS